MAEKKKSYRDQVVEELLGHIEAGTAPWQKPWEPGKVRMAPFNPVSGKDYRGINALWLEMRAHSDPRWMTYRQASAQDAQVRKGEKGTMIEYWKWSEREKVLDDNGKPVLDDKGVAKTRDVRLDRPRVFHAVVFNADQIDGLAPYMAPEPTFNPVERAEQILKQGNVPIFHDQNDRAFYRSSTDQIHMPHQATFKGQYEYYATALHELGHATGHGSRMAREFGPFGSEVYAKEELRAEIASYMLTTELGLGHYPERHAAYVGSWMKAIKEDRNALFASARDAENIRTWVMEPEKRQSLIPVKSKEATKSIEQNPAVERQKENAMTNEMSQAPNQDTDTERKRIYLNVPFSEKDEAKALGAKWDRRAKAWYARDAMELEPFKRWQETKAKAPEPKLNPEDEFAQALKENGLILDGPPTMDGKWHR
ncbi:zincin-like metallopeptidase domain-containing protein, partial [Thalassospira sp.]